jgi:hypothetical protein
MPKTVALLSRLVALCLLTLADPAFADNEFFTRGPWQDPGIETRIIMQPVHDGDLVGELYLLAAPTNFRPSWCSALARVIRRAV